MGGSGCLYSFLGHAIRIASLREIVLALSQACKSLSPYRLKVLGFKKSFAQGMSKITFAVCHTRQQMILTVLCETF